MALLVACAVDYWHGEPHAKWHPVVWMGNYLGYSGAWLQHHTLQQPALRDSKAFCLSVLLWAAGAAVVTAIAYGLQTLLLALPWWLAAVGLGYLLKPLFAWRMLRAEVLAVEVALSTSLAAGRERLHWLVSRDVTNLSPTEVRESAIETLAENLNDSVVAPLFWFLLLGLPGAALYRFANTADAMWGYPGLYKGQNWAWAGKWAARVDDVLSYVPARLSAIALLIAAGARGVLSYGRLYAEAGKTPSPNSGWPMAAMALNLDVALRKPGVYVLHPAGRSALAADVYKAVAYASKALLALLVLALVAWVLAMAGPVL